MRYYILSLLLHGCLVLVINPQTKETELLPFKQVTTNADKNSGKSGEIIPTDGDKGKTCKSFYGGIGVYLENMTVTQVINGYPAQTIGVRVGDDVYSLQGIEGEIGEVITLVIIRNGNTFEKKVKREKICIDK